MLVGLDVTGQIVDSLGQDSHLYLWGAAVGIAASKVLD